MKQTSSSKMGHVFNTVKSNLVSFQFFIDDVFGVNRNEIIFRDSVSRLTHA